MNREIPVFFTIDNNFAPYLSVALASMIEHASREYTYKAIVLHEDLTDEGMKRIKCLEEPFFRIEFVKMKQCMDVITDRMSNRLRSDYFTLTIYFRLFISDMFPQYDKGIYVDSDIVVSGDISKLYDIELGNNLIGACIDHSIQDIPELVNYMDNGVGVGRDSYINSGILLMNLKEMRNVGFAEHFLYLLNKYHFDSVAPDQDYLNVMCYGRIDYIPEKWDVMPTPGSIKKVENPQIIHYNLFAKPWCYDDIQYEDIFWEYADKSAFKQKIYDHKKNYSDEQKKADDECLRLLVARADKIGDSDENFRTVFNEGKERRI